MKIFTSNSTNESKNLSYMYRKGNLRRIAKGVYTDDLITPIEEVVKKNWMRIVAYLAPNAILTFRTGVELKPSPHKDGCIIFMVGTYSKTINLPGFTIKIFKSINIYHSEQVLPNLARANIPRLLLENLIIVRKSSYKNFKTIGYDGVENFLAKELKVRGEDSLNTIRDQAKIIANELNMDTEYKKLNKIIRAMLSTGTEKNVLCISYGKSVAKKEPYDLNRINSFENLSLYLKKCNFQHRKYQYSQSSFKNISFFESYFSNYIEGTEFVIEEAEDIVFQGKEINNRHADSHDVLANFILANDFSQMSKTPESAEELITILKERHAFLMKERTDINPGIFKTNRNKSGNTYFVEPSDVIGTLTQGFEIYLLLKPGLKRALFMQFLISEVHPFNDGNGRVSRIMMNAELVSQMQTKIIVPTVHRDNYLNGLKMATSLQNFKLFCKVMDQAHAYTHSVMWQDYGEAREKIEKDCAGHLPDEGVPIFNRALRNLVLSDLSD